ncbi:MAG: ATP-binding protein [Vampirovibrionia bacterium]
MEVSKTSPQPSKTNSIKLKPETNLTTSNVTPCKALENFSSPPPFHRANIGSAIILLQDYLQQVQSYDNNFHGTIEGDPRKTHIMTPLESLVFDYSFSQGLPLKYLPEISPTAAHIENTLPSYKSFLRNLLKAAEEKGLELKPEDILITGSNDQIKKIENIHKLREILNLPNWIQLELMVSVIDTAEKIRQGKPDFYERIVNYFEPNLDAQNLLREEGRDVKDRFLANIINNQSPEKYRSIVELVSNAVDASITAENSNLNIKVNLEPNGYTVIDNGIGMSPEIILSKLLIPTISGKSGDTTIGRFGVGFYTALSHLQTNEDLVRVTTNAGEQAYSITFQKRAERGDRVCLNIQALDNAPKGTKIEVQATDFKAEKAKEYLEESLKFNTNADISMNHCGVDYAVNNLSELKRINIEATSEHSKTEILYSLNDNQSNLDNSACLVHLLVNGVTIEKQEITGTNLPRSLALNFPIESELAESRNELAVNNTLLSAAKLMVDSVIRSEDLREENKITLLNALYPVTKKIQDSNSNKDFNLVTYIQDSFRDIKNPESVYLPNSPEFQVLKLVNHALFINPGIVSTELTDVNGIEKAANFKTNPSNPHKLYLAEFNDPDQIVIQSEKKIILNSAYYSEANIPILNKIFSNLGPNDEMDVGHFIYPAQTEKPVISEQKTEENIKEIARLTELCEDEYYQGIKARLLNQTELDSYDRRNLNEAITGSKIISSGLEMVDIKYPDYFKDIQEILKLNTTGLISNHNIATASVGRIAIALKSIELLQGLQKNPSSKELLDLMNNREFDEIRHSELSRERMFHEMDDGAKDGIGEYYNKLIQQFQVTISELTSQDLKKVFNQYFNFCELPLIKELSANNIHGGDYFCVFHDSNSTSDRANAFIKDGDFLISDKKKEILSKYILNNDLEDITSSASRHLLKSIYNGLRLSDDNFGRMMPYFIKMSNSDKYLEEIFFEDKFIDKAFNCLEAKSEDTILQYFQHLSDVNFKNRISDPLIGDEEVISSRLLKVFDLLDKLNEQEKNKILEQFQLQVPFGNSTDKLFLKVLSDGWFMNDFNFSEVPNESRPYLMYLRHGGEILEDTVSKDFKKCDAQLLLSGLISLKNLNDGAFMNFHGSTEELNQLLNVPEKDFIDSKSTKRQIAHAINNQGVNNDYIWIRELIQNAIDAASKMKSGDNNVSVRPMKNKKGEFVLQIQDPLGMNQNEVINYLLAPGESSKRNDSSQVGKFGQGFFTIFKNSRDVTIQTSKGDGTVLNVKITPLDIDGRPLKEKGKVFDLDIQMFQESGDYRGTTINNNIFSDFPEMEGTFAKSALMLSAALVDANKATILYKDKAINSSIKSSAIVEIPNLGTVKAYRSSDSALTQNGLYIKKLDPALIEELPKAVRAYYEKQGLVIDLPPNLALIQSRNDIVNADEVIPEIKKALPNLVTSLFLKELSDSSMEINPLVKVLKDLDLPYDFFEKPDQVIISEEVKNDIKQLKKGESISFEKYSASPSQMLQFIVSIDFLEYKGEQLSLKQLAGKLNEEKDGFNLQSLPKAVQEIVQLSFDSIKNSQVAAIQAKAQYGISNPNVVTDFKLTKTLVQEKEKQISPYLAFDKLRELILDTIGSPETSRTYYLCLASSLAHASSYDNRIGWNLNFIEDDVKNLATALVNSDQDKFNKLLEKVLKIETHEYRHLIERSEDNGTHNQTFYKGQREILMSLLNKINPVELFENLKNEFPDIDAEKVISKDQLLGVLGKL